MTDLPTEISNMDITYADSLIVDFHYQVAKSSAADQADGFPLEADMIRLEDRIGDLEAKLAFLSVTPLLDAPETHGRALYEVPTFTEVPIPSNRDIVRIMNFLEMFHREMTLSQSSRMTNGISGHDSGRYMSYISNLRGLIENYIKERTPNDFPEVSPKEPQVGPGN